MWSYAYSATSCRGMTWIITGSPYKKDGETTAKRVACLHPAGSKKRGHTKADNISKKTNKENSDISPCLCCSDLFPTAESAKAGCIAGSVAGGHTVNVSGMSEFMCEICVND